MAISPWTHPKHCQFAVFGTLLNGFSLVLIVFAVDICPAFVFSKTRDGYTYSQFNIDCNETAHCIRKDTEAGWMICTVTFLILGMVINILSFIMQFGVFWPMSVYYRHYPILLRIAIYVDLAGGYCKFFAGMVLISHSPYINRSKGFQMKTLPIGLTMLSFILEVLGSLLFILALDRGVSGGMTHRERIMSRKSADLMMHAEAKEAHSRKRSSFIPRPESTHGHVAPVI